MNRNNVLKKLNQTPQARRGLRRGSLQYQGTETLLWLCILCISGALLFKNENENFLTPNHL